MKFYNIKLYKLLKSSKFIYFTIYCLLNKDYKVGKRKMKKAVKPLHQIEQEMQLLRNYWHCNPAHYIRYKLYNKQLDNNELIDYIPPFYFYNFYLKKQLRNINQIYYNNKLNLYYLFINNNIPTPEVIFIVERGILKNMQGEKISPLDILNKLELEKKYFFKPIIGAGGTGIEVLKIKQYKDLPNFLSNLNKKETYIVQAGIEQRDDFKAINKSSVNTLRIVTQYNDKIPKLCACALRMGRNNKDVDNSHQGGLSCQIDENNGSFNEIAIAEHGGDFFYQHPDSGFVFAGKNIENWEYIKSTIISYAKLFPELKDIGWDIAVTTKGIQVIELNLGYGLDHIQMTCGGMRQKLNIYPNK